MRYDTLPLCVSPTLKKDVFSDFQVLSLAAAAVKQLGWFKFTFHGKKPVQKEDILKHSGIFVHFYSDRFVTVFQ